MLAGMSIDMFTDPDTDPRADPPTQADERATIIGFLRQQRDTLELKCSGLRALRLDPAAGTHACPQLAGNSPNNSQPPLDRPRSFRNDTKRDLSQVEGNPIE
jgi:hypothetical protein